MSSLGPLENGGKVVILGGGPGGTACALMLNRLARESGKDLSVTIVEGKRFAEELHHNQCVGVLSDPVFGCLEDNLNLPFPRHLSRGSITGYVLHTEGETIAIEDSSPSVALRRVQFDGYMLDSVRDRGISVISARGVDLEITDDEVVVYTENGPLKADVLVGAFGLDEGSASMLARVSNYRSPVALSSVVTKLHPGADRMVAFGSSIHAFLPSHPRIEFGGITPKRDHLTINIAGKSVDSSAMREFLQLPLLRELIGSPGEDRNHPLNDGRFFKGRFPCALAHGYYGDRYVVVGDAAGLVRPFKGKGVTSAIQSGIRAARTIFFEGVSQQAFHHHYRAANQEILKDFPYGRAARLFTVFLSRHRLLGPVLRAAKQDANLRSALFGAVSGHTSYKEVLSRTFSPGTLFGILRSYCGIRGSEDHRVLSE